MKRDDERVVLEVRADGSLRTMSRAETRKWRKSIKSKIRDPKGEPRKTKRRRP